MRMKSFLKIRCGARTDKGKVRNINEDHLLINKIERRSDLRGLYAVADGMGGPNAGEIASQAIIKAYASLVHSSVGFAKKGYKFVSEQLLTLANSSIYDETQNDHAKKGMCSTFTGILIESNHVHLAHVGDSRAYVQRFGRLQQISEEHSYYAELLRQGKLTPAQYRDHTDTGVILRAVGLKKTIKADYKSLSIEDGDVILLCTDGLTDLVTDNEINQILLQNHNPQKTADQLVDLAIERGGADNITAIVLFVGKKQTDSSKFSAMFRIFFVVFLMLLSMSLGILGAPYLKKIQQKISSNLARKNIVIPEAKPVIPQSSYGILSIHTQPEGAFVVVDSQTLDDKTPLSVRLEAGKKHLITIAHQGYEIMLIEQEFFKDTLTETLDIALISTIIKPVKPEIQITKPKEVRKETKAVLKVQTPVNKVIANKSETVAVPPKAEPVEKPVEKLPTEDPGAKTSNSIPEKIVGSVLLLQASLADFYYSISGEGIDVPPSMTKRKVLRRTGFSPGQYVLTVSKEGFIDQEIKVKLIEGKVNTINIDFVKDFK